MAGEIDALLNTGETLGGWENTQTPKQEAPKKNGVQQVLH